MKIVEGEVIIREIKQPTQFICVDGKVFYNEKDAEDWERKIEYAKTVEEFSKLINLRNVDSEINCLFSISEYPQPYLFDWKKEFVSEKNKALLKSLFNTAWIMVLLKP